MGSMFACPDWVQKLEAGQTPIPDLDLDPVAADVAVQLFDKLRLPDVPGQPTYGEVGGEWVRDIVRAAFGSVDWETGARQVGEVFNLIPKKNGKTTNAAAIGLIALQMNRRPNVDMVIIGPTQAVADKCFAQAAAMIRADEYLSKRFWVIDHLSKIVDQYRDPHTRVVMNATLKVKSFDAKVVTGSIPAVAIIDELHVMAQSPHASRILAQIRGGMITNPESLLIFITTQSDKAPAGVFKEELDYARRVRDGDITRNVRMLPVLYEFPEEIQRSEDEVWRDTALWPMVLPNLGRSFSLERLHAEYETAREKGVEALQVWTSQHLNIQIGMALSDDWVGARYWLACADETLDLDSLLARSEVAVIGGDVGGADDLFSLTVIGREAQTRRWLVWTKAWATGGVLERRKQIAPRLRDFERQGDLSITASGDDHVAEAVALCRRVADSGLLPQKSGIGLDPHGVAALVDALIEDGFPAEQIVGVSQGYKLNGAVKGLERRLMDRKLRHSAQEILDWSVSNAKADYRGNNVYITKSAAGVAKIDPLIALLNAAMLMDMNPMVGGGAIHIPDGYAVS